MNSISTALVGGSISLIIAIAVVAPLMYVIAFLAAICFEIKSKSKVLAVFASIIIVVLFYLVSSFLVTKILRSVYKFSGLDNIEPYDLGYNLAKVLPDVAMAIVIIASILLALLLISISVSTDKETL